MRNVKMLHQDIPAYQLAKRARLDQLAHDRQEDRGGIVVVGVVLLMILLTGIALIVAHQEGWW